MDIAAVKKSTQKEIAHRIKECEQQGNFCADIQPINYDAMRPVTAEYRFLPRTPGFFIWKSTVRFIAAVFGPIATGLVLGARVRGRKNLRGVKGAVVTCNHVHVLDNMIVRQAVFGRTLYITVAEFNNRNDLLGLIIRGAGTLPFSSSPAAMNNLNKTIAYLLEKKCFVLGYPEQSLWLRYEKPRPYHDGMFHIAVENNVPVVPLFITFREPSPIRRIFSRKKTAVLHILAPVYPKPYLNRRDSIQDMRARTFDACVSCYTETYGKAPVYR